MLKILTHRSVIASIIAVCFYVLCFPKFDFFFFAPAFFAFAIIALWSFEKWQHAFFAALISGFAIGIGGFHWIVYVNMQFGGMPFWLGVVMLLGFCLIVAPHFYLFYVGGFFLRTRLKPLPPWLATVFVCLAFTALEFLVRYIKLFPENLGNTWILWLEVAQVASLGGVSALTFLAIFPGSAAAFLAMSWRRGKRQRLVASGICAVALGLVAGAHLWGRWEITRIDALPKEPINVAMIQANVSDKDKMNSEGGDARIISDIIRRYSSQMERAVKDAIDRQNPLDLVIWPETAYPLSFPVRSMLTEPQRAFLFTYAGPVLQKIRSLGVPALIGAYESEKSADGLYADYNSAVLLSGAGQATSSYRKVMLLLFGEVMPLQQYFPVLKKLNPQMGDFGVGPGPIPLDWNRGVGKRPLKIGVNICYEAIMPEFMRGLAVGGADFFVNLTNDSWFGPGFEPWQHLQLAQLRTIENRLPMARATNTGVSIAVDAVGRTLAKGPLFAPENVVASLPIFRENPGSFYRKWGECFAWAAVAILLIFLVIAASENRRNESQNAPRK